MPVPADYSYFQVGGASYPLVSPGTNTLLRDADPAVYFALDWFSFVISQYCGARLLSAASGCGLGTGPNAITAAVAQRYPRHPKPQWLQSQLHLPLLVVARTFDDTGRLTAGWEHERGHFDLLYVLPPLTAGQEEAIGPILHAVGQALRNRTTQAWDPAYTPPGGVLGAQFDSLAYAGVEAIGFGDPYRDTVRSAEYGYLEGTGDITFPLLRMSGYILERDMPTRGVGYGFAGGDVTGNIVGDDGTVVQASSSGIVMASTQQPPTLVSVLPTSGTYAGGTAVTLTGTLFLPQGPAPLSVQFGTQSATSVAYVSGTSCTCVTPAMLGTGAVDVTFTNPDGQSVTLPQAFAFN